MGTDSVRAALRGLRSNSIRAQRRRNSGDPKSHALLVSIGLADPNEPEEMEDEEDDDDDAMPYMRRGR